MQAPFNSTYGIVYPTDMAALKQVYDLMCRDHGIHVGSREADDLAQATMSLFSAGIIHEEELVASLTEYLNRKTGAGRGRIKAA